MPLLKLTLEYDGSDFSGWAVQPGHRTVEGELRRALETVHSSVERLTVAGRTDAGVHARGQVASYGAEGGPPAERLPEALNAELPPDVRAVSAEVAPEGFHARHSARSRTYRYRIWTRTHRLALRARALALAPPSARRGSARRRRGPARRRARLPRLHADGDTAPVVRPGRRGGPLGARRRRAALLDHGEQLPQAHGPHPRRDDARARAGRARAAPRRPPQGRGGQDGPRARPVPRARRILSDRTRRPPTAPGLPAQGGESTTHHPPSRLSPKSARMCVGKSRLRVDSPGGATRVSGLASAGCATRPSSSISTAR